MIPGIVSKASSTPTPTAFNPIGKSWLMALYDAADSPMTLTGSLIDQINDISGNARHATQPTAAYRTDYTAVNTFVDNRATFGKTAHNGRYGLITPSFGAKRIYVATRYRDGLDSTFGAWEVLLQSPSNYRVISSGDGTSTIGNFAGVFASTARINQGAETAAILPLPLSVLTITSAAIRTAAWQLLYQDSSVNTTWSGKVLTYGFTDGSESDTERDQFEQWIADKNGITL